MFVFRRPHLARCVASLSTTITTTEFVLCSFRKTSWLKDLECMTFVLELVTPIFLEGWVTLDKFV